MAFSFPPAPSWNSSSILTASSEQNLAAYGSKSDVVIIQPRAEAASPPVIIPLIKACPDPKAKIVSVSINRTGTRLAIGVDNGTVRRWTLSAPFDAKAIQQSCNWHQTHKEVSLDKYRVAAVSWSETAPDTLVSVDESGLLVVWDSSIRQVFLKRFAVAILRTSPHLKDVCAMGCARGLIVIANYSEKGEILHRIRHHDQDIHDLSWSPSTQNFFEKETEESLLAVSCRDQTVSIWSANSGKLVAELDQKSKEEKGSKGKPRHQWVACHWFKPHQILTSGANGILLSWDIDKLKKSKSGIYRGDIREPGWAKVLHQEHKRNLFSVCHIGETVLSVGHNRALVSFTEARPDYVLPTFASFIYCLEPSPMESSLVAIGAGDGSIRLWKQGSTKALFDVNSFYGSKSANVRVMCIAWHPTREGTIAFGTDEGRIGMMDVVKRNENMFILNTKHRGSVYNLCFGPPAHASSGEKTSEGPALYSCGDNVIFMHSNDSGANGGYVQVDVETIIRESNSKRTITPKRSSLAFHPNRPDILTFGSDDGSVEIFLLPHLQLLATIKSFEKLIQELAWHPTHFESCEEASAYADHLAIASNHNDIHVFDLKSVLASTEKEEEEVLVTPDVVLSGHHFRVVDIKWSPHEPGKLVSASYDQTVQVWDVFNAESSKAVSNFPQHDGRLFCCNWSTIDPDLILSGGEDCTLNAWKISEQQCKIPPKKSTKRPAGKLARQAQADTDKKEDLNDSVGGKSSGSEDSAKERSPDKNHRKDLKCFTLSDAAEVSRVSNAGDDLLLLAEYLRKHDSEGAIALDLDERFNLGIFGDEDDTEVVLKREIAHLASCGDLERSLFHHLLIGDVEEVVRKAMNTGTLTDHLVSLANSCSRELWKEACEAYAVQLGHAGSAMKAACYYLLLHKANEAIEVLRKKEMFMAAIALVKSRLSASFGICKELYRDWALKSASEGRFELSAKCWLAAGSPLEAARVISKRSGTANLKTAFLLCLDSGESEMAKLFAVQAAAAAARDGDADLLQEIKERATGVCDMDKFVIVSKPVKMPDKKDEDDVVAANAESEEKGDEELAQGQEEA